MAPEQEVKSQTLDCLQNNQRGKKAGRKRRSTMPKWEAEQAQIVSQKLARQKRAMDRAAIRAERRRKYLERKQKEFEDAIKKQEEQEGSV